jgi:hypothetical protein
MSQAKTKPEPHKFHIHVAYSVFVKRVGEKNPWYKHGRTDTLQVEGATHDEAFYIGERELAKVFEERFGRLV